MIRPRSVLHVKLLRDLWRLRAQAAAIALVIAAGVGMVVMSWGMIRSMDATRAAYYERYRFADIFAPVKRAPESFVGELARIPGVAVAESRISAAALLDVPGIAEPVTARVHSLPPGGVPRINALVLRSGRFPDPARPEEVVASEAFARAARLAPGDRLSALLYGNKVELELVGTVLSPEYVYTVAPGQVTPDNRRFGILWMGREPLAGALDLVDAFNDLLLRLDRGAQPEEVIRRLDLLLAPHGGAGAFGRDRQTSAWYVDNEIEEQRTLVRILPPIFLLVAAFLLNIVLVRLVDTEREVIGLLKAFGYRSGRIMLHYGQLALLLSLGGLLLGAALGTWLGRGLAGMYQDYFVFPFLEFRGGLDSYAIAAAVTLAAVVAGSVIAVRRAARLAPAEAMRPPAPADFSGRLGRLAGALGPDEPSRMILRGLLRRPLRSLLTVTGLAAALAIYIASAGATDNVGRMLDLVFGRAQRADLTVTFAEPRDRRALHELQRLPGVLRVEPFRSVPARLSAGPRSTREALASTGAGDRLTRIVDLSGRGIDPPERGAILSASLAERLGVGPGDRIAAAVTEGDRPLLDLPVAAVVDSPIGSSAYVERAALARLMREEGSLSGAYLAVDAARLPELYARLKETPLVAGVAVRAATVQGIRALVEENMGIVTLFNTGFAALIVLGVVYNGARISLSERARDLASMRVLGFRRREVAFVLLGEQAVLVLAAIGPGILLGVALSRYMSQEFSNEIFRLPFAINPATLAEGVLVVAAAAAATALLIRNRVDRLDLVRALKTRE